ncbi:uncharacterized protein LOC131232462 [Magnolia sinica]|uniref:uncharacterized protein LOC131232462 n=1 Tax=Magnolia sinica TaxID=86752 RepID=UPI0026584CAD|nr:uncharacterized protein LOC131232462 [Magnolia sinica]
MRHFQWTPTTTYIGYLGTWFYILPQRNMAFQGMTPTHGEQPNRAIQGMSLFQGDQPNMAFQGTIPPQGNLPNMAFQGMIPPHGNLPNMAFQGMAPPQGDQPNMAFQGMGPPHGGQPNMAFQGMVPPQGGQLNMAFPPGAPAYGGQPMAEMPEEDLRKTPKEMFRFAMNNQWEEVVNIYKEKPYTQSAKITSSEDTILHIAVTTDKMHAVEKLVKAVTNMRILELVNDRGNTALHLAAAMGNVGMCICMADRHSPLVAKRNKDGETPLFLAALHGKKNAFIYLHSKCPPTHGTDYWRRNDGNNILHVAISGEYFDLAYQIIKKYKTTEYPALDLVNFVNERGQSALHLLASNPSAFKSGSHLGRLECLIYHCIVVKRLEETPLHRVFDDESQRKHIVKMPENYTTCMQFYLLLRRLVHFSLGVPKWAQRCPPNQRDRENPDDARSGPTGGGGSSSGSKSRNNQSEGRSRNNHEHPFPPNYVTCYDFFELALVVLQVLGLGFIRTYKIKEKKQKHTWAVQIMEELVSQASSWEYNATGSKPQDSGLGLSMAGIFDGIEAAPFGNELFEGNDKKEEKGEKMGEILQKILNIFPTTDDELRRYGKNTVVMKMEDTQPHMYKLIMEMMKENEDDGGKETPILVAAKKGVKEMVEEILEKFPVAVRDEDKDGKNTVLLAVENRQPHVYKFLVQKYASYESIFQKMDNEGNSALHLAAMLGQNKPWLIPGAALQMQWEIKWYKFVKESMPRHFFTRLNNKGQTSKEVFTETHKELVKDGGAWLTNTSQSCSVVAALIATVAFATATAVPGGINESTGTPTLEGRPAFEVFAITSLIALCSSVTSLTMFLAILTSRYQEADFRRNLPAKLILGLTSLFVSIASILVSFCAGHFFVLKDRLKYAAFPVYGITCLPVTFFAAAQFPLYLDLIRSFLTSVPRRTYEVTSL